MNTRTDRCLFAHEVDDLIAATEAKFAAEAGVPVQKSNEPIVSEMIMDNKLFILLEFPLSRSVPPAVVVLAQKILDELIAASLQKVLKQDPET